MYIYSIEINDPKYAFEFGSRHTRVLRDEYEIGDPYRLCQKDSDEDNPFPGVVWGGVIKKKLIHEGDIINIDSVTVVRIHEDEVEFERDGHRWTQKEDDEAGLAWW